MDQVIAPLSKPKTSRMAIWSLILSCIPFVCPVGLVLGIISAIKISKHKDELSGQGWAVGGIAIGAINSQVSFVLFGIIAAIAIPNMIRFQNRAKEAQVKTLSYTIQTVIEAYKEEHNGERPKSMVFIEGLLPQGMRRLKNPFNNDQTYSVEGGGLVDGVPVRRGQVGYIAPKSPNEPYEIVANLIDWNFRLTERQSPRPHPEEPPVIPYGL